MYRPNFYILTGGPGSGKSTVLQELATRNFNCIPEAARTIIQQQTAKRGNALPWDDTCQYTELMFKKSIADFLQTAVSAPISFFDRGIPDVLGYANLIGLPKDPTFTKAVSKFRYNPKVFLFPPWKEIYQTDQERKQNFETAVQTYRVIKETYLQASYELIEIPFLSVTERANFIRQITLL